MIKYMSDIGSDALKGASNSYGRMETTLKGAEQGCSTCA